MAVRRVWSGGDNTGGADNPNWAEAYTTIGPAILASANNDTILVHKTHQETVASMSAALKLFIICVDKDAGEAQAEMGLGGWINTSTTFTVGIQELFCYGLSFIVNNTGSRIVTLAAGDGYHATFERCRIGAGLAGGAVFISGPGTVDRQTYVDLQSCTLVFGTAASYIEVAGKMRIEGGSVEILSGGTAPTSLFVNNQNDPGGATVECFGADLSALGSSNLVGNAGNNAPIIRFVQCKLGSGYVALSQTGPLNKANSEVWLHDCAVGDTHVNFEYHDAIGSIVTDTGIKFTGSPAGLSWKVVSKATCSPITPFFTPWCDWYHTGTSSITPYFEILRDGSATPYQDDQVAGEFMAKVTAGSVRPSSFLDRMALFGTPANQAAGTDTWDGVNATHWAGKVDSGSAFTPAEVGALRGRLIATEPSITFYVDPVIRT